MLWVGYLLKVLFIGWLVFLSIYDIRLKKIPIWGMVSAGILSLGVVISRLYGIYAEGGKNIEGQAAGMSSSHALLSIALGILPGLFLILLSIATKKVGLADGILLCFVGLFENYLSAVIIFCISSFILAIVSVVLLVLKRVRRNSQLPFVPFLVAGYVVNMVIHFCSKQ